MLDFVSLGRGFLPRRPTEFSCREVCEDVLLMHSLAKERRAKRFQSGALSLNTPKLSFKLDDNGNPAEFRTYPIRDSNRLVEVGNNFFQVEVFPFGFLENSRGPISCVFEPILTYFGRW